MKKIRVDWSFAQIQLVESMGVGKTEVEQVLGAVGRRLVIELTDDDGSHEGRRVISDVSGRLVEVWLAEADEEGWYAVIGAFEAGIPGTVLWNKKTEGELE